MSNSRTDYPVSKLNTNSFNSSLRFDFTTRYNPTKNVNLSFRVSPTYSALHETQNDSFSPQYSLVGQYNTNNLFFVGSASFRETKGLLLEDLRGRESNFSLMAARRLDTPLIPTEDDRSLPQTIEYKVAFRDFSAEGISFSSLREISPSLSFVYPMISGGTVNVGYVFTDAQHTDRFGSDYANFSHELQASVRALVAERLSISFASNLKRSDYKNYDSRERFQFDRLRKRVSWLFSLSAQLNYQFHRRLSMFSSVSASVNRSNLDRGFIYWAEGVPVGFQEITTSSYRSLSLVTGVSFRF